LGRRVLGRIMGPSSAVDDAVEGIRWWSSHNTLLPRVKDY
jgi:hypothetical protein